ncbi:helix-turn-helix domain-containing protein [Ensifer soli]|uniref:helix-turn-helix domain-containing protein n=1 Tax=Ciceribacter sp. sgz301302 TaxID=3342379 RepID=UPI0035BB6C6F
MKERKRSMKSLSADIGLPYRSLQNYLSGSNRIPTDVYVKILELLGIDNQYIMEGNFDLKYWPLWDSLWSSLGGAN